jgi:hypothetical protein
MEVFCKPDQFPAVKIYVYRARRDIKWTAKQSQPTLRNLHIYVAAECHDADVNALYWQVYARVSRRRTATLPSCGVTNAVYFKT